MLKIPAVSDAQVAFGAGELLPNNIPVEYYDTERLSVQFIKKWFFDGLQQSDVDCLHPREGVIIADAIIAIHVVLKSWAINHSDKMAGCAFMLEEWFEIGDWKWK